MSVVIRLTRRGAKKSPSHRICVFDKRRARDSKYIEDLGWYDPKAEPTALLLNTERAKYWLGVGALPTPTVMGLMKKSGMKL